MEEYEQESERRGLPLQHVLGDDGDRRAALRWLAITGVVVAALIALAVGAGDGGPWWFFAILALIGGATLFLMIRNVRVWVAWGNPQLFLPSSDDLCLGDRITARFRRRARGLALRHGATITAVVRCREIVRAGGDADSDTVSWERPVEVSRSSTSGSRIEADLIVEIPLFDAPPTTLLEHHEVQWQLVVRIVADGIPDDDSTFVLSVAPALAARVRVGARPGSEP